jgi:hypothetical protein
MTSGQDVSEFLDILGLVKSYFPSFSSRVPGPCHEMGFFLKYKKGFSEGKSEKDMEGSDGTCEGTDDTTTLVQIEEAKYAICKLPFVTALTPVRAVGDKGPGWQVSLSCSSCQEYSNCPKNQDPAVRRSCVYPTEVAWLQELLKRQQDRHVECAQSVTKKAVADAQEAVTVNPDTPNVLQTMMKLEKVKVRAKNSSKVALEVEKENDAAEKAVEELKRQLQPKRAHTDDDVGDAHDLLAELIIVT